jgi:ketosteroid isomerase-like protein
MRYWAARLPFALATFFLSLIVTGLFSPFTNDSPAVGAFSSGGPEAREVLRAEAEYVRANNARDAAALDPLLADDVRAGGGRLRTKAQRLAFLDSPALEWLRLETEGTSVRVAGTDAWVVGRARLRGRYAGRGFGGWEYEYTRHYEKRDGRWQIVSMSFAYAR